MSRFVDQGFRLGGFCVRHVLALVVTAMVPCFIWTVSYFILILQADGMGSPLVYPIGLILVFSTATLTGTILLFPAVALAEWMASRFGWPVFVQLSLSGGFLACASVIVATIVVTLWPAPVTGIAFYQWAGGLFAAHLIPLSIYWLVAQSGALIMTRIRKIWSLKSKK